MEASLSDPIPDHPDQNPTGYEAGSPAQTTWRNTVRDLVETLVMAALILVIVRLLIRTFWIEGSSMEPNLHQGQYLIVSRVSYWFHPPQRGDVIVFRSPNLPKRDLIKRVIGLPGEQIDIYGGQVRVNGQPLDEPYSRPIPYTAGPWILGQHEILVLGDNRGYSQDSHNWGTLPIKNIIGKAWWCYWPPSQWGRIPHYIFE